MSKRMIPAVSNMTEKQLTYRENIKKYNLAMKYGFYYEAMLIDYAMIEDRLRSLIYYFGLLKTRDSHKVDNEKIKDKITEIVEQYKTKDENNALSIQSISGKRKIVRTILEWTQADLVNIEDDYLKMLKSECESCIDIGGLLDCLIESEKWCEYRNEIIHALLNKNTKYVNDGCADYAVKGMEIARYIDSQVKNIKKNNKIRKTLKLK